MQWKCFPVRKDRDGTAAIHYTPVYNVFARWADDGSLEQACSASAAHLSEHNRRDLRVLPGDGTHTVAKKGSDGIGSSGHKPQQGVFALLPVAPVNTAETILLLEGLKGLKRVAKLTGLVQEGAWF